MRVILLGFEEGEGAHIRQRANRLPFGGTTVRIGFINHDTTQFHEPNGKIRSV